MTFLPVGDSKAAAANWPTNLQAYLSGQVSFNQTPTTLAVGGQTILGGGGTPSLRNTIDASLAAMNFTPSYILWNLGINDAHPLNGYPPDQTTWKNGVLYCWDALRTKWPSVPIKMMYVWRAADLPTYPDLPANCGVLDSWYADILPSRPFVSVIADERIWLENGDNGATYTSDGTHYSAAGNQKAADLWRAAMGY